MKLFRDNIPTVCMHQTRLETTLFEDEMIVGMMPLLFAINPTIADTAMKVKPDLVRRDLIKLQKLIFAPENVAPAEALKVLQPVFKFLINHL